MAISPGDFDPASLGRIVGESLRIRDHEAGLRNPGRVTTVA